MIDRVNCIGANGIARDGAITITVAVEAGIHAPKPPPWSNPAGPAPAPSRSLFFHPSSSSLPRFGPTTLPTSSRDNVTAARFNNRQRHHFLDESRRPIGSHRTTAAGSVSSAYTPGTRNRFNRQFEISREIYREILAHCRGAYRISIRVLKLNSLSLDLVAALPGGVD